MIKSKSVTLQYGDSMSGRPSDRVREYIHRLRDDHDPDTPVRLPSIREISQHLGVSTATIYHVYRELTGQGKIMTAVGRGSYLPPTTQNTPSRDAVLCIGLNWTGESDGRLSRNSLITQGIINATTKATQRVNIRALPVEAFHTHTHTEVLLEEINSIDALIYSSTLKEFYNDADRILSTYESKGKPVVRLDAPDLSASRNFVSSDNFHMGRKIGYAFARSGRKRVAYLMRESLNATVSTLNTLIGLQSGLALGGIREGTVIPIFADSVDEASGYTSMKAFIRSQTVLPDAIFCFADVLAMGAIQALKEAGLSCPDDVSIVGGTGYAIPGSPFSSLTRAHFSFDQIGKLLVDMVISRVAKEGESVPAIYVPGKIILGETTRPEENEWFSESVPVV